MRQINGGSITYGWRGGLIQAQIDVVIYGFERALLAEMDDHDDDDDVDDDDKDNDDGGDDDDDNDDDDNYGDDNKDD